MGNRARNSAQESEGGPESGVCISRCCEKNQWKKSSCSLRICGRRRRLRMRRPKAIFLKIIGRVLQPLLCVRICAEQDARCRGDLLPAIDGSIGTARGRRAAAIGRFTAHAGFAAFAERRMLYSCRNGTKLNREAGRKPSDSNHSTAVCPDDSLPVATPRFRRGPFRGRTSFGFNTLCREDM
jgi:hypothetical protein